MKKYKRPAREEPTDSEYQPMPSSTVWADLLHQPNLSNLSLEDEIYSGEGEDEDPMDHWSFGLQPYVVQVHDEDNTGKAVVNIEVDECKQLWAPWRRALVVKLLGRNVSSRILSQRLTDMWALNRRLEIVDLEDGFFVVRFVSKEDYMAALENYPWTIQGHYLTISKFWHGFLPSAEKLSFTLVWVRIPRLPLEYFHENVLMRVGSCLGKAVKIDHNTMTVSRGKYARVCVEVDLEKPLTYVVFLNGQPFTIEYENLHLVFQVWQI